MSIGNPNRALRYLEWWRWALGANLFLYSILLVEVLRSRAAWSLPLQHVWVEWNWFPVTIMVPYVGQSVIACAAPIVALLFAASSARGISAATVFFAASGCVASVPVLAGIPHAIRGMVDFVKAFRFYDGGFDFSIGTTCGPMGWPNGLILLWSVGWLVFLRRKRRQGSRGTGSAHFKLGVTS
jgi:hypothetical protein